MQGVVKYVLIVLVGILICLELVIYPVEWRYLSPYMVKCLFIATLLLTTIILAWKQMLSVPWSLLMLGISMMYLLNLFSGTWAVHLSLIWPSVVAWSAYIGVFVIGYSLPKEVIRSQWIRYLILGVITFNIGQVVLGYVSVLSENDWSIELPHIEKMPHSLFHLNTNFIGSIFLLYIPFLLAVNYKGWLRWIAYIDLLVVLCLLPLFNSRAVTLALIVLVSYYMWRAYKSGLLRNYIGVLMAASVVSSLIFYSVIDNKQNFLDVYSPTRTLKMDTGDDRIEIWHHTFSLIKENPLLGQGAGNWTVEIYKYGYEDYKDGNKRGHAHSIWLETAAELGVIGIVVLLCIIFLSLGLAIRSKNWHLLALILVLCILCSFYGFYRPSENTLSSYLLILYTWLGIGSRHETKFQSSLISRLSLIAIILWSVYLSVSNYRLSSYLKELDKADKPSLSVMLNDWDDYDRPIFNAFKHDRPLEFYRSAYLIKSGKKHQSIKALENALVAHPYDRLMWYNLGRRYTRVKNNKKAIASYKAAIDLYSRDTRSSLELCRIGLHLGDSETFNAGMQCYHDYILPLFQAEYDDEYLTWSTVVGVRQFWLRGCKDIDQYQDYLDRWQTKQEGQKTRQPLQNK